MGVEKDGAGQPWPASRMVAEFRRGMS